jgi:hypothetical protein
MLMGFEVVFAARALQLKLAQQWLRSWYLMASA